MKIIHAFCIVLLTALYSSGSLAQMSQENQPVIFIEPEIMVGSVVHNYPGHPNTGARGLFSLNIGSFSNNLDEHWAKYYNQPSTGIVLSFASIGNKEIFGNEISLIPFIEINTSRKKESNWYFKFGMGASYFTKFYNSETNIENEIIGSHFTYSFKLFLYKSILLLDDMNIKVGGGYLHSSNGHTQLPNFGLNSAMISVSAQLFTKPIDLKSNSVNKNFKSDKSRSYFITTRTGYGWQEYGGTRGPVGGPKKAIFSYMISGGIIYRQHIKIRTGLTYRIYEHYLDDILETKYPEFINNPKWSASNVYFLLGTEFLIGHVGMDIEGGINLYKPFFDVFFDKYEKGNDYWLKKTFPARMGINYYLISTNKKPKHNIYGGVHINANFGQADFAEISFGYSYSIK